MAKQLTVAELIEQLKEMPQDYLVEVEGCDCFQPATGVFKDDNFNGGNRVLINSVFETDLEKQ